MQKIILASQSKQRKAIFETLGLPFEIIPADLDEKAIQNENLVKRAEMVARAKAEKITLKHEGIVISADTFCVLKENIFEKPNDIQEAKEMLTKLSGNTGKELTGFCYIDQKNSIDFSTTVEVEFTFRKLSEKEIEHYVTSNPVTTWSGAFSPAYHEGTSLVSKINGSFTAFIYGLPMELVVEYLQKSGIKV
jgi:septum formation protein